MNESTKEGIKKHMDTCVHKTTFEDVSLYTAGVIKSISLFVLPVVGEPGHLKLNTHVESLTLN